MLKDCLVKAGLDQDSIAEIAKEFVFYNKEKIKVYKGEGDNAILTEQMRDGNLSFKALQLAAKYIEPEKSTVDVNHNHSLNIDNNTAKLAIINLLNKLEAQELKEIQQVVTDKLTQSMKPIN